jgi:SHS family lactate transporter-like MFS transporter
MAFFIAGGTLIVIAISIFDTARWMPKDLVDTAEGAAFGAGAGSEELTAGNAAH